jgi:hypothetical protein
MSRALRSTDARARYDLQEAARLLQAAPDEGDLLSEVSRAALTS